MWENIEERVLRCGEHIVKTGCTVRACAECFGTSKSTVHKDVTERLAEIDAELWERVQHVLSVNLKERHLRGGDATKRKYQKRRLEKKD
ncbi:MAG: sporulation transcriptional regulator SpoIIID [Clostridia bacterium]|nr:sporulation transcriptional regulator SpoIIID [Clostridia bacterium]